MRHISHEITYGDASAITIVPIGDIHLGHANCDEGLLAATVERVKADPTCYWIGMGDMAECISRRDPRHVESNYADWLHGVDWVFKAQRDALTIETKCLHCHEPLGIDLTGEFGSWWKTATDPQTIRRRCSDIQNKHDDLEASPEVQRERTRKSRQGPVVY